MIFPLLQNHLRKLEDIKTLENELLTFLDAKESYLTIQDQNCVPNSLKELNKSLEEHKNFTNDLSSRKADVDKVCKIQKCKTVIPGIQLRSKIPKSLG